MCFEIGLLLRDINGIKLIGYMFGNWPAIM